MLLFFNNKRTPLQNPKEEVKTTEKGSRVVVKYQTIVSESDKRVLEQLKVINQQVHRTMLMGLVFNGLMFFIALVLISISLYIFVVNPGNNRYQHYFSVIALLSGFAILGLLFFRNPITGFHQFISNYTKVNMLFITYVRQVNLIDAAIDQVFMQDSENTLENTQNLLQQFQDLIEITIDRSNQLLDDL